MSDEITNLKEWNAVLRKANEELLLKNAESLAALKAIRSDLEGMYHRVCSAIRKGEVQ